jgi:hypothetical protein
MSARKRRIKRKIVQLVRMDDTRSRMPPTCFNAAFHGTDKAENYWYGSMKPLALWLADRGHADRSRQALEDRRTWRVYTGGNP